ncbi:MAG: hypothetical protein CMH83_13355 [Nocardioides sp.]|nr:hypothetical protein [Nocardioides sp.]
MRHTTLAPATADVVPRSRLDDLLRRVLEDGAVCSTVVMAAPPGFGKTTLARAWAGHALDDGWEVAWVDLTEAVAHPRLFWAEILRALSVAAGRGSGELRDALAPLAPPDRAGDLDFVLELLDALAGSRVLLVLDDVHLVHDPGVLGDLDLLVRRLPSSCRTALLSRSVPPLRVCLDLRLSGRMLDLRATDLAFTVEETDEVSAALSPAERRQVWTATEGWPALARLMAAAVEAGSAPAAVWDGESVLFDALFVETLRRQSAEAVDVLMAAALDDVVPLDLVVEVSGRADAGAVLEGVAQATSLVRAERADRPADGLGYRLHASLRAYLRGEQLRRDLPAARRRHRAAARWYLQRGDDVAAVVHARDCGDGAVLDDVLAVVGTGLVADGHGARLLDVLQHTGGGPRGPWTRLVRAYALLDTGRQAEAAVQLVEPGPGDLPTVAPASAGALRTALGLYVARLDARAAVGSDRPAAAAVPAPVADDLPVDVEMVARTVRGAALVRLGLLDEADVELEHALRLALGRGRDAVLVELHSFRGAAAAARTDVRRCREHVAAGFAVAERRGWGDSARCTMLHLLAGWTARATLEDVRARHHVLRAAALVGERDDLTTRTGVEALGWATAHGTDDGAGDEADRLHRLWQPVLGRYVAPDVVAAVAMADAYLSHATQRPERLREVAAVLGRRVALPGEPAVVEALRLIARGQRRAGLSDLRDVATGEVPCTVPLTRLEAQLLVARVHAEDGDRYLAVTALREALTHVDALGALRPVVEVGGEPVVEVLREQRGGWGRHEDLVGEVLDRACGPVGPSVPLTDRESDVLRELPTMRTVEEIAESLVVSVNTVKTHLRSVYRKLGVASRRDAIAEARRAGLL